MPNKYVLYSFTASDVVCYVSVLCEVLPCVNVAVFDASHVTKYRNVRVQILM